MKKLALILALSFMAPMVAATVKAASNGSDLAIGDPQGGGYHRTHKRHKKAASTSSTTSAPTEGAKPAPEKAPAKAAEPAK